MSACADALCQCSHAHQWKDELQLGHPCALEWSTCSVLVALLQGRFDGISVLAAKTGNVDREDYCDSVTSVAQAAVCVCLFSTPMNVIVIAVNDVTNSKVNVITCVDMIVVAVIVLIVIVITSIGSPTYCILGLLLNQCQKA